MGIYQAKKINNSNVLTPPANYVSLFFDETDNKWKYKDEQGDLHELGEGGDTTTLIIQTTQSELTNTLIPNKQLKAGVLYEISGCDAALYGGTTIWLKAITDSELEEDGIGEFFNIDYTAYPIARDYNWWYNGVTPEIYINPRLENAIYFEDDVVIWGGKAWICHTDIPDNNTDYILNDFELNTSYFTENTNVKYNRVIDKIKYNISLNKITYREDEYGNIVEYTSNYFTILNVISQDAYINGIDPIKALQWGRARVRGNIVYNSLLLNINFRGSLMTAMELKDYGLLCYTNIHGDSTAIVNCVISKGFALQYNTFQDVFLTSFYLQGAVIQSVSTFAISMMAGMNFKNGFFSDWDNVGLLVGIWGGYEYVGKNIVRMDFSRATIFKIPDLPTLSPNGIILNSGNGTLPFKKEIICYEDMNNDKYGKLQCVNGLTGITFIADLTD